MKAEPAEKEKREMGPHTQQGRLCCCQGVTPAAQDLLDSEPTASLLSPLAKPEKD